MRDRIPISPFGEIGEWNETVVERNTDTKTKVNELLEL